MGDVFGGIFGGGDDGGGGGTQTVVQQQQLPPYLEGAINKNLGIADELAARPYTPYTGERIAGFAPEQQQAFQKIRDAQGGAQPFYQQAGQTYQEILNNPNFLQGKIAQYQNPYENQVVQSTLGDIDRQRQMQQNQAQGQAVSQGAFGGTRQAIANTENTRNYNQLAANTAGTLRAQGFNTAAGLANQDINRQVDVAGRYAGLGTEGQRQNYADINTLQALGQTQQATEQQRLDLAYKQFLEQQNYPLQQLALRQAAVGASPIATGQTTISPMAPVSQPNFLGNILGGASAGAGLFGSMGGNQTYGAIGGGLLGMFGGG